MTTHGERECRFTFADLVDELTINIIKQVVFQDEREDHIRRMNMLVHDLDQLVEELGLRLSASLIRRIATLAQINQQIWLNKDKMEADKKNYSEHLKLAHQLNGIRNRLKNSLLQESGELTPGNRKTNIQTDDLKGWTFDISA